MHVIPYIKWYIGYPHPWVTLSPSSIISSPSPTITPEYTSPSTTTVIYPDRSDFTYADIKNVEFWLGSGVGAWSVTLKIQPDGTFSGYYSDTDGGDGGSEYPNGTRYECYFSGKFSPLKKAAAYTFTMKCISVKWQGKEGEERIIDDVRVITMVPSGFEENGDFYLYLPGKNINDLSEDFLGWGTRWSIKDDYLETYGLYDVKDGTGYTVLDEYTLS